MRVFKATVGAIVASMAAGTAFAADLPSRKAAPYVPPPPVFTWTGFYVGANAGGTITNRNGYTVVGAPISTSDPTNAAGGVAGVNTIAQGVTGASSFGRRSGAILGVQAGYNYQFASPFVLGIEADIQGLIQAGQRSGFASSLPYPGFAGFTVNTGVSVSKRLDYLGTVRARAGYSVTPAFLLYVTGGLAYGQAKSSTLASAGVPGTTITNGASVGGINQGRVGYTVGAGAEYFFLPNFSLKAEYLYYDLGSVSYNANAIITNAAAGGAFTVDLVRTRVRYDGHVARLGVNYHFWAPAPVAPVVARY